MGVVGFEPTQPKTTDLQSAPTLQLRRTPFQLAVISPRSTSDSQLNAKLAAFHFPVTGACFL